VSIKIRDYKEGTASSLIAHFSESRVPLCITSTGPMTNSTFPDASIGTLLIHLGQERHWPERHGTGAKLLRAVACQRYSGYFWHYCTVRFVHKLYQKPGCIL